MEIKTEGRTEISRRHFHDEGERIKVEDKKAVYEIRDPKELAMQVDFGFARYDIILRLIDKYAVSAGRDHLDLGCGLGYMLAKMSERGFKVNGADISRSFLDIAEEKLRHAGLSFGGLVEADLQKPIDMPEKSFDIITSTDVLEHIENPDTLLRQIHRLLKDGGRAVICTNNSFSIWGLQKFITENILRRNCFHPIDHWYTFSSLRREAQKCGFGVIESKGTYFLPLARLKRLFSAMGIYGKRFEINELLSGSIFKYFGRDIIMVLEKKSAKHLLVRENSRASFSLKRRHTLKRIINLLLTRTQLFLRTSRAIGYPAYLVVEPTNICNLKCPLCPTGKGVAGRPKGKMSFADFKKIIDELGSYLYTLRLENWGEPLLNEEIFEMVSFAKTKGINCSFNTNLSFLDEKSAEKLVLSGLDHIKISLDGASQQTYARYRVGGSFDKVIGNIKLLVSAKLRLNSSTPFIEAQFIVMKHNEGELDQIKELCSWLGVDGLLIEKMRPDMREELFSSDRASIEKYRDWLPEDPRYSVFDYKNKTRNTKSNFCGYLWTTAVINWDGSVVPCCSVYDECYDFGNIFKEGFRQVWNGRKYRAARRLIGRGKGSCVDTVCGFCSGGRVLV